MKPLLNALMICCVALSTSCANVQTLPDSEFQRLGPDAHGVVLSISLDAKDPILIEGGCKVQLRAVDGLTDYTIDLHAGTQVIFVQLEPGDYRFYGMFCFGRRWRLTQWGFPIFKVSDSIGVVGATHFSFDENRTGHGSFSDRKKSVKEMQALLGRLSENARSRLVSAYTGTSINSAMINQPASYGEFDILDLKSGESLAKDEEKKAGKPNFLACYRGEEALNGLWIGNVEVEAIYKDGNKVDVQVKPAANTFTPQFVECVKLTLKEFTPGVARDLKYKFFL